ncbi:MAG: autotransporter outer membrane beta-barrel domain-containing protein [Endomicrobium sp.]|jgi:hypothetical protein|nr:autotransporter outer membrane beta-barrel domain-containing protein [Endomicrobium sp.]
MKKCFLPSLSALHLVFAAAVLASFSISGFAQTYEDLYGVNITQNSSSINVSSRQVALNGNIWTSGASSQTLTDLNIYNIYGGAVNISTDTNIGNINSNYNSAIINSTTMDINEIAASSIKLDTVSNIGRISSNGNYTSVKDISAASGIYASKIYAYDANEFASLEANLNKITMENGKADYLSGVDVYVSLSSSAVFDVTVNGNEVLATSSSFSEIDGSNIYIEGVSNARSNNNKIMVSHSTSIYGYGYITGSQLYIDSDGYGAKSSAKTDGNIVSILNFYSDNLNVSGGAAYADNSSASYNQVIIDEVYSNSLDIYGGYVYGNVSAQANENVINMKNITSDNISIKAGAVWEGYLADSFTAAANKNSVRLENINATANGEVYGGYIEAPGSSSNADENSIYIESSAVSAVLGAYSYGGQVSSANRNSVKLVNSDAYYISGANASSYSGSGLDSASANGNEVYIVSGSVSAISAGQAESYDNANANKNKVEIDGSVFNGSIYAGSAYGTNGRADDNYIKLSNVSGDIYGIVASNVSAGGQAFANGNEIVIENISATVYGIIGGMANGDFDDGQIEAVNNTISITGDLTADSFIYGGYAANSGTGGADFRSGNTLNIIDGQITAGGIGGFENYNFYIGDLNVSSPAIYAANGNGLSFFGEQDGAVDISSANIKIFLPANANIGAGRQFHLIESGLGFTGEPNSSEITAKQGVAWLNTFDIYVDTTANVLNAGFIGRTLNPQTKNLSESIAAGAALIGQGADIFGGLLGNIQEGKLEVLGAIFGGSSKYDTGSSVEINSLGLIAGAAKKFKPLTAGVFVEYADGSYDTENDFDGYDSVKGDGKASYIGGGVLAKKDIKENIYIEGQARAGQITNDYKTGLSDGQGNTADFDYSSLYFGVNIGAGYKYKISEKLSVKGYGKYIFTNVGGGDADLSTGEKYEFDAVMSNRVKAGIKGAYKISEKIKPYIGIAYDYEVSGEINAKIDGAKIEAPTLNGGTFQGEAGASIKVIEKLNIDVSAQIYTGAREGFAGLFKLKYEI